MTIGIVGNAEKPALAGAVEPFLHFLLNRKIPYRVDGSLLPVLPQKLVRTYVPRATVASKAALRACDLLVSFGGDGTMLRTARLVAGKETPILGVNLGGLGFLAEVKEPEIAACLEEVLSGNYQVESRMMLLAEGKGLGKGYTALNDIVLDLSESSRVMHVETFVDGSYLATFTGDGMIVCTPTGSTGYALSNGGPILPPQTPAMMVSAICPHTLTARPVVLPEHSTVTLRVQSAPARIHLTADGQPTVFLKPPIEIRVRKAPFVTKLVKRVRSHYFDVLREKLQWGRDIRTEKPSQNR